MNRRQRKFFSELAGLLQKHNASVYVAQSWLEENRTVWNISGDFIDSEEVPCLKNMKPSTLREAVEKSKIENSTIKEDAQ